MKGIIDTERIDIMCKVIGYARISTKHQSIERQIRNIKDIYPEATIVTETYTGTKADRPEWNKVIRLVEQGKVDKIVFDSVSRMSRNKEEGFRLYKYLYEKGIELEFIKEPHINSNTYKKSLENKLEFSVNSGDNATDQLMDTIMKALNTYMFSLAEKQIELAFEQSEKEVDDLHKRTSEGIETARLNGKQIGQIKGTKLITKKSIAKKAEIEKYSKDFKGNLGDVEVIKITGLARNTYYKYKKELKEEY